MKLIEQILVLLSFMIIYPSVSLANSTLANCFLKPDSSPLVIFQDEEGHVVFDSNENLTYVGNANSIKIYNDQLLKVSSDDDYTFSIPIFSNTEGDFWAGKRVNTIEVNFVDGEGHLTMKDFTGIGDPGGDYLLELTNCTRPL